MDLIRLSNAQEVNAQHHHDELQHDQVDDEEYL